jgi:hypothetical protein
LNDDDDDNAVLSRKSYRCREIISLCINKHIYSFTKTELIRSQTIEF